MRIDKYLKVSRIIKRRSLANEACSAGKVIINGKTAKASSEVKTGDILEIKMGQKELKAEILKLAEHTMKEDASAMYKILQ
ncbi:MAG: RNA-binding S4 domain-containing protein [Oscillospiraceae bacterium]|nr:RNA-binding S4 domain-containing protein [Oscillospiraceae bacterium]